MNPKFWYCRLTLQVRILSFQAAAAVKKKQNKTELVTFQKENPNLFPFKMLYCSPNNNYNHASINMQLTAF